MKNLHVGGVYYGCHNIGDEAILYSIIKNFSDSFNVSVSTYGSDWIEDSFPNVERHMIPMRFQKPKYGIYSLPRRNVCSDIFKIRNELKYLENKDYYICGGATILSDCPWYSLRTVQLANKNKTPVILWGVGMAEVDDKMTLEYIARVLNSKGVKKIFTRDEIVLKRLIDNGIKEDKLEVCYDPAIMLDGSMCDMSKYLSREQLELYNDDKINIVVTLSGETDVIKRTPIDIIIESVKEMQIRYDANIFLIPTGCGTHCKDSDFLNSIKKRIESKQITLISKEFSPNDLVEFLKNVKFIISSRLHMNIFGACANTPSIGLVRNTKIIDFATLYNLPYLELDKLTVNDIMNSVEGIITNYENITNNMNEVLKRMRKQHLICTENAKKIIKENE